MIAPHGLVGAALVAWGFAVGLPAIGTVAGLAFELLRFTSFRWLLTDNGLANGLRLLFLATIGAFVASIVLGRAPQSLYLWLRWLPVLLFALPLLQVLQGGALSYAALRHSLRFGGLPTPDSRAWDATHGYALCCLIATGTAAAAEPWYYPTTLALIGWALAARMRTRRVAGILLLACAGVLGLGVSTGLFKLQAQLEEWGEEFLEDLFTPEPDPFRERTRIGDMGRVKLNDRILMRVIPEGPRPSQILLRESAFDGYRNGVWESAQRTLHPVLREGEAWRLAPEKGEASLIVRRSFPRGEGLLPLPAGAASIEGLDVATLEATDTGSVRVKGVSGAVRMRVTYDEALERAPPGDDPDREVPESLRPVLEEIVATEGLRAGSAGATLANVERYFGKGFAYSLQLSSARETRGGRSITDFLLRDRKGHCEYFATATVLLLRQAGVPARYVVGYSAQEFSALEKAFIVRNRHAHAWAQALVDGRWVVVDTTPGNWAEQEEQAARSSWGPVIDVFSWAWDLAQRLWAASNGLQLVGLAVLLVFLVALPWILRKLPRWRVAKAKAAPLDNVAIAWRDVEARVRALGFARGPRETVRDWARRLSADPAADPWRASLADLAALYYRARFDPAATTALRDTFLARARVWGLTPYNQ